MKDRFGREITYLRLSLTDRCNFRCIYCMPKEGVKLLSHNDILSVEEFATLTNILTEYGIKYVRLTGGEPLIRKGVLRLIELLSENKSIKDISITTNGFYLKNMARALKERGIRRINISLDSVREDVFRKITRTGELKNVLEGIEEAKKVGFDPIKINSVIMKGINEEDIYPLLKFARENNLEIRFIEFMPNDYVNGDFRKYFISTEEIKKRIKQKMTPRRKKGHGPEDTYILEDGTKVGFISAISHNFCANCNRIRITSTGRLNPCLMSPLGIDLKPGLRPKIDNTLLRSLIEKALHIKPKGHTEKDYIQGMNAIGG